MDQCDFQVDLSGRTVAVVVVVRSATSTPTHLDFDPNARDDAKDHSSEHQASGQIGTPPGSCYPERQAQSDRGDEAPCASARAHVLGAGGAPA